MSPSPPPLPRSGRDRGSVLPVVLIAAVVVGGAVATFLGRAVVEQRRVRQIVAAESAHWLAFGQMELAREKIATSLYVGGKNDVLETALASNPPVIPGTGVAVEQVPGTGWHRLTAVADRDRSQQAVQAWVRDTTSYVAYNYYVEGVDLGISGTPKGRIHSNGKVQVYFGGGRFDDLVSSHDGFEYLNGATVDNTVFAGGADGGADQKELLGGIDYADLAAKAVYVGLPGHEARISLLGDQIRIKEIVPPYQTTVDVTRSYQNYIGDALVDVTQKVYIGDVVETYQAPVYRYEDQLKDVLKSRQVWVEFATSGTGTDTAGGTTASGYWDTEYYYETQLVSVKVLDHYETRTRTVPQYETVVVQEWQPQYETVYTTETKTVTVTNEVASDRTFPADGIFYFSGDLNDIQGTLNGNVTLVTEGLAEIDGNVQYQDASGNLAYRNGTDPSQPYVPNPDFVRDHSFAIVAQGDIRYDRYVPDNMELNGTLISTGGFIGYEGIGFDANGDPVLTQSAKVRTSLRRFGSIMSMKRPVATLLSSDGSVQHGFRTGASVYDTGLLNSPPPGAPNADAPMFKTTVRVDGALEVSAGLATAQLAPGVTVLTGMAALPVLRQWVASAPQPMDWGTTR